MEDKVNALMDHWKGTKYAISEFIVVTEEKMDDTKLNYEAKLMGKIPDYARSYAPDFGDGFVLLIGIPEHKIDWPSLAAGVRRSHYKILTRLELLFNEDQKKTLKDLIRADRDKLLKTVESVVDEHLSKNSNA